MKLRHWQWIVVALLVLLGILYRVQYVYPHHPDHFTWGQYTNVMIDRGYAPWVLHPLSLLGYYPLGLPSGLPFFFSALSSLTGLAPSTLFDLMAILFAFLGAAGVYLVMRTWRGEEESILAAFVLLTMVFYAKVTQMTASTRIFNIVLTPFLIYLLFMLYESWGQRKRTIIYGALTLALLATLAIIHRLSQLSLIFMGSFALAVLVHHYEAVLGRFKHISIARLRQRSYAASRMHLIADLFLLALAVVAYLQIKAMLVLVVYLAIALVYHLAFLLFRRGKTHLITLELLGLLGLLAVAKGTDLLIRGRLAYHLQRALADPYWSDVIRSSAIILAVMIPVLALVLWKPLMRLLVRVEAILDRFVVWFARSPRRGMAIILLVIFILANAYVFLRGGVLGIDQSTYYDSFLLEGRSPPIILANFLLNINNNLTILIWLSFIGLLWLFLSREKLMQHWFFMFSAIFFSQLILDWEYVRLYMNPLYSIMIALGIWQVWAWAGRRRRPWRRIGAIGLGAFIVLSMVVGTAFLHREAVLGAFGLGDDYPTIAEPYYVSAGEYLRGSGEYSLLFSDEAVRYQRVAYYGGVATAVAAQSIYTKPNLYNITALGSDEVWETISRGEKLREFYQLRDWIFDGDYYHGRHIFHLINNKAATRIAPRIIEDYSIRYMVHSPIAIEEKRFFTSIKDRNNVVYSSGKVILFDVHEGFA